MHKVLHKLINYSKDGVNVIAHVNTAIASGSGGTSYASARSESHIVQRNGQTATQSTEQTDEKEVTDDKEES